MIVFAQLVGILAMVANILSFQFKSKKNIIFSQLIGSSLFAVNMFMLNALMGCILNIIGIIRAIVYINKDKIKINITLVNVCFAVAYVIFYILVFTVFGKACSLFIMLLELLPVVGMSTMTLALSQTNTKAIRIAGFINSPCWLIYNIANLSIGGIMCEVISITSVIIACLRFDTKKDK